MCKFIVIGYTKWMRKILSWPSICRGFLALNLIVGNREITLGRMDIFSANWKYPGMIFCSEKETDLIVLSVKDDPNKNSIPWFLIQQTSARSKICNTRRRWEWFILSRCSRKLFSDLHCQWFTRLNASYGPRTILFSRFKWRQCCSNMLLSPFAE